MDLNNLNNTHFKTPNLSKFIICLAWSIRYFSSRFYTSVVYMYIFFFSNFEIPFLIFQKKDYGTKSFIPDREMQYQWPSTQTNEKRTKIRSVWVGALEMSLPALSFGPVYILSFWPIDTYCTQKLRVISVISIPKLPIYIIYFVIAIEFEVIYLAITDACKMHT